MQEYEVLMTKPDNTTRNVYAGRDQECAVAGLLPGRPYLFQVRPTNKTGVGIDTLTSKVWLTVRTNTYQSSDLKTTKTNEL